MYTSTFIKTINKDPTRLLKEVYDNVLEKENSVVPDYYSVKSTMYRQRATKIPELPGNFKNLSIPRRFRKTVTGERFLLKNDTENGLVVYSTTEALTIFASCEYIIGDGTFKSCPPPYVQLYVLLGIKNDEKLWLPPRLLRKYKNSTKFRKFKFIPELNNILAKTR